MDFTGVNSFIQFILRFFCTLTSENAKKPPTLKGPGNLSECDRGRGLGLQYPEDYLSKHHWIVFDNCKRIINPPQDGAFRDWEENIHQDSRCINKPAVAQMLLLAFFRGSKGCGCRCLAGCNGLLWMKVRPTSAPSAQRVPAKPQLFWALRPEDVPNMQGKGTKPARSSGAYAHDPTSWLIHRTGWMGIWDLGFAVLGGCLISPGLHLV